MANISGMSNRLPAGEVDQHAEALSAPAHSPTMAPTTASVTPTRMPPRIVGSAAGISRVVSDLPAGRPQRSAELEQARIDRRGSPTIVAMATGKNTISAQISDLAGEPRPEPQGDQRREREDRRRLGGDEVRGKEALDQRAPGERVADDDGASPAPTAKPERDLAQGGHEVGLDGARPTRR